MSVETPCPSVWSCRDSAIAAAAVDRFIPHVPALARRRCQCAWAALGAGEAGPAPETTTRFLSPARFVTPASVEPSPSMSPTRTMDRSSRPTRLPWRFWARRSGLSLRLLPLSRQLAALVLAGWRIPNPRPRSRPPRRCRTRVGAGRAWPASRARPGSAWVGRFAGKQSDSAPGPRNE